MTGLEGKPLYYGLLVGALIAGMLVALVHFFPVATLKTEIQTLEDEIDTLETRIAEGRAAERELPQFRDEVARLELELERLKKILPSQRNTEEIIKKVKALVDEGDFVLKNLNFPEFNAVESDIYMEWPISVALDGRYHDLAILFNKLGNFSRIMNVENIQIDALSQQDERTVSSQFTAKTFVLIEETGNEEGTPGGE
ncbi:MAG: type 4a pilus biogenesis protein PilO [Acidobacteria bacterium]|nr:type 4a pilus biogenesis protein PilO [Acidobacteriota bacterium]